MNRAQRRAAERSGRKPQFNHAANMHRQLTIAKSVRTPTDTQDEQIILIPFFEVRQRFEKGKADLGDIKMLFEMTATTWRLGQQIHMRNRDQEVAAQLLKVRDRCEVCRDALTRIVQRWDSKQVVGMSGDDRAAVLDTERDLTDLLPLVSKGILIEALLGAADDVEAALRGEG